MSLPIQSAEFNYLPEEDRLIQSTQNSVGEPVPVAEKEIVLDPRSVRPLTAEEAGVAYNAVQQLRKEIAITKSKINNIIKKIDEVALKTDGGELVFDIDLKKRLLLKRAVQKAFGVKTNTLTYSMYIEALKARQLLIQEEGESYLGGDNGQKE